MSKSEGLSLWMRPNGSRFGATAANLRRLIAYMLDDGQTSMEIRVTSVECEELKSRIAKLEEVVKAARHLADMYDGGCQCGYYTEDATEETGMNICGACAVDAALKALDEGSGETG